MVVASLTRAGRHRAVLDLMEAPMKDQRFNYGGIGGAVAGVVGLLGIYAGWWDTNAKS